MYSARQLSCLKAMGIPAWVPRGGTNEASEIEAVSVEEPQTDSANESDSPVTFAQWVLQQQIVSLSGTAIADDDQTARQVLILSLVGNQLAAFDGGAGKMLDAMLTAISLQRERATLGHIVSSCIVSGRSALEPEVADTGESLLSLLKQHDWQAVMIFATPQSLPEHLQLSDLRTSNPVTLLPGSDSPVRVIMTYHPEHLLQQPLLKREAWEDLKCLRSTLGAPG